MLGKIRTCLNRVWRAIEELAMPLGLPRRDRALISRIRNGHCTYLSRRKLASLARTCSAIEDARLPGIFLEAGCALGGSAILIASLKNADRPLLVYDVFGIIPPPSEKDTPDVHNRYRVILDGKSKGIGGEEYYGYRDNLFEVVLSNLEAFGIDVQRHSVTLVKGLVQETMIVDQPVALAHVDVDWYEPGMTCLTRIFPHLVLGGSIILDDYHDWGGCRRAADEYLQTVVGQYGVDDSGGSLRITRTRSG